MARERPSEQELRRLARELAALVGSTPVLAGTLTHRHTRCGRAGCRCSADPPVLHGPYWSWTRKVNGKTVTRYLSEDQAADYGPWFEAAKQLRALVDQIEAIGLNLVEADPRSHRRSGGRGRASPRTDVGAERQSRE